MSVISNTDLQQQFFPKGKFLMHNSPSHLGILLSSLVTFHKISRFTLLLVTF